jgi:signal peptidase II
MSRVPPWSVLAATAVLGIAIDQVTKVWVVAAVEGKRPIHLIGTVLMINVSRNTGASFSFAPTATVVFTVLAVAVAVVIARSATRLHSQAWAVALGLILAGAVGNLIDRLLRAPGVGRGGVVDFIDLKHFATFNGADSAITCGAVLAVLLALLGVPMTDRSEGGRRHDDSTGSAGSSSGSD